MPSRIGSEKTLLMLVEARPAETATNLADILTIILRGTIVTSFRLPKPET